jgi:hypothetical protein
MFRVNQLKSLQKGLEEMKDDLCEAVEKDLGRAQFFTYIAEICTLKTEITHTL